MGVWVGRAAALPRALVKAPAPPRSPWRVALERGLGPITLGILFAVGLKILRISDHDTPAYAVSCLVCVLMLRTRISPLLFMAVCGVLGAVGLLNSHHVG